MPVHYRSYLVWLLGIIVNLLPLSYFIINGWPGSVNGCALQIPDSCYCEGFSLTDVQQHQPGVRQFTNTWSNLYAIATALLVAVFLYRDRKLFTTGNAPNPLRSADAVADLYVFAVLFLGLGSMWFHASITEWGGLLDGFSMYVFAAFLVFYSLLRLTGSYKLFWWGYVLTLLLFLRLHHLLPSFVNIVILVGAYLLVEIFIWRRTGVFLIGRGRARLYWGMALLSILAASYFWWASQTGQFLCQPASRFQPHGLLWHTLAGVMAVFMYFYWREEVTGSP